MRTTIVRRTSLLTQWTAHPPYLLLDPKSRNADEEVADVVTRRLASRRALWQCMDGTFEDCKPSEGLSIMPRSKSRTRSHSRRGLLRAFDKVQLPLDDGSASPAKNSTQPEKAPLHDMRTTGTLADGVWDDDDDIAHNHEFESMPFLVIHPNWTQKLCWDVVISLCIIWSTMTVPFFLCFDVEPSLKCMRTVFVTDILVDVSFFADIVISFCTAYQDETGLMVTKHKLIARRYLPSFIVDFISTFPFDLIQNGLDLSRPCSGERDNGSASSSSGSLSILRNVRLFRIVRLSKLFKLAKVVKLRNKTESPGERRRFDVNPAIVAILHMLFQLFFVGHLIACVRHGLTMNEHRDSVHWKRKMERERSITKPYSRSHLYILSLYWAFTTMTTVGYGDIPVVSNRERLLAIFTMIVGGASFGYIIGSITSLLENFNQSASLYREKVDLVKGYVYDRQFPAVLGVKVVRHFKYVYSRQTCFDRDRILNCLPSGLAYDLTFVEYRALIHDIPVLQSAPRQFTVAIVPHALPCFVERHDFLFFQHEVCTHLYCVANGTAANVHTISSRGYNGCIDGDLSPGAYVTPIRSSDVIDVGISSSGSLVGLEALLVTTTHNFTTFAKTALNVYLIPKGALMQQLELHPRVKRALVKEANSTLMKLSALMPRSKKNDSASLSEPESARLDSDLLDTNANSVATKPEDAMEIFQQGQDVDSKLKVAVDYRSQGQEKKVLPVANEGSTGSSFFSESPNEATSSHNRPAECSQKNQLLDRKAEVAPLEQNSSTTIASVLSHASSDTKVLDSSTDRRQGDKNAVSNTAQDHAGTINELPALPKTVESSSSASKLVGLLRQGTQATAQDALDNYLSRSESATELATDRVASSMNPRELWQRTRVFHPEAYQKVAWDCFVCALILYSVLTVTYRIGFSVGFDAGETPFTQLDYLVDFLFFIDIGVCFNTAFMRDLMLVSARFDIAKNYVGGPWFWIDTLSTIPMEQIHRLGSTGSGSQALGSIKLLKSLRLVRIAKITRVIKLNSLVDTLEDICGINPALLKPIKPMIITTFVAHLFSCVFFHAGRSFRRCNRASWLDERCIWRSQHLKLNKTNISPAVECPKSFCPMPEEMKPIRSVNAYTQYLTTLYWAFATMTTVGYGDVAPSTENLYGMILVIISQVLGTMLFAYLIGVVVELVTNLDPMERRRKQGIDILREFAREQDLTSRLDKSISQNHAFHSDFRGVYDESEIMDKLPPRLRNQCCLFVHCRTLASTPLLCHLEFRFPGSAAIILGKLKPVAYVRNQIINDHHINARELHFILEGSVYVKRKVAMTHDGRQMPPEQQEVNSYAARSHFGQETVLVDAEDRFTLNVEVVCRSLKTTALVLSKEDYDDIAQHYSLVFAYLDRALRKNCAMDRWVHVTAAAAAATTTTTPSEEQAPVSVADGGGQQKEGGASACSERVHSPDAS